MYKKNSFFGCFFIILFGFIHGYADSRQIEPLPEIDRDFFQKKIQNASNEEERQRWIQKYSSEVRQLRDAALEKSMETPALSEEDRLRLNEEREYRDKLRVVLRRIHPRDSVQIRRELHELPSSERLGRMKELVYRLETEWNALASQRALGERPDSPIDQWRFRGFYTIGNDSHFSLHNPWDNQLVWAEIGDKVHGVKLISFDADTTLLTIRYQGVTKELALSPATPMADVDPATPFRDLPNLEEHRRLSAIWSNAVEKSEEFRELDAEISAMGERIAKTREQLMGTMFSGSREGLSSDEVNRNLSIHREEMNELVRKARELSGRVAERAQAHPEFADVPLEEISLMLRRRAGGRVVIE